MDSGGSNRCMFQNRKETLRKGIRDGLPVALGYFAVSFSLGISARNNGVTPLQAMVISLLCNSSSGEYAGFTLMGAHAAYIELAVMTVIINARYILMGCALAQRFQPGFPLRHRLVMGFDINDELFALTIRRAGCIHPYYSYGIACICIPAWAAGTFFGALTGNVMPIRLVSAFSVALYGMFLAVIIPPAKGNKVIIGLIIICFAASFGATYLPVVKEISSGTRMILLTIIIAGVAAVLFPVRGETENIEEEEKLEG